jgi:phenylalanyl-tRNA synthetase beta chain
MVSVKVPSYKNDIHHQADLVEEIMRIDGLDNIEIPSSITISPSAEKLSGKMLLKEKIASYLAGSLHEIFTNSITDSKLYAEDLSERSVKMINSLSNDLDMLRPEMLNSGLSSISYNINRKNSDLKFFEFGKTYSRKQNDFTESEHLALYLTGDMIGSDWGHTPETVSLFHLKGLLENIFKLTGTTGVRFTPADSKELDHCLEILFKNEVIGICGQVAAPVLKKHGIKQPVFYADLLWLSLLQPKRLEVYREISKFPVAERDLAMVLDKKTPFSAIEKATQKLKITNLTAVQLFDVFESEKLGEGKKSVALNFTFADETKTLTDEEIDAMVQLLVKTFEKELNAEIRK